jgi:hypothetical protein
MSRILIIVIVLLVLSIVVPIITLLYEYELIDDVSAAHMRCHDLASETLLFGQTESVPDWTYRFKLSMEFPEYRNVFMRCLNVSPEVELYENGWFMKTYKNLWQNGNFLKAWFAPFVFVQNKIEGNL